MGSTDVVEFLSAQLGDKSLEVELRIAAAEGLGYSGFSNGRDALTKIAQDENELLVVRQAATRALGKTLYYK